MIPKVIHYCWLGGEQPKLVKKCIESWKEKCPDYEIRCWNEDNFDLAINDYVAQAYQHKKFAFVSDFMRMYILYNYGGIYLDTDFEVLKSFDDLLDDKGFTCFECDEYIGSWIFASEPKNPLFKEFLDYYEDKIFVLANGQLDSTANPKPLTIILREKYGLSLDGTQQRLDNITVYPAEYFCPFDNATGVLKITDKTYGIHWFSKSWMSKSEIIISNITRVFHRLFGVDCFKSINKLINRK